MINKSTIDQIMQTARIEEVIGDFVHLKRAGSNFKALSPFTEEKTPSFVVSPAKQIFKDFSSSKGGNVITFLKEHEQMTYPEALRYLAGKYNIEVEEDKPDPEYEEKKNKRESLYVVTKFAESFFTDQLFNTEEGKSIGLSYFKERNFTVETIKKFGLGYAPGKNTLLKTAEENGYKEEFLLETGLIKKNDRGTYDGFRERVIFPIHDLTGRPVGFGARTLRSDQAKTPKYINSPESEIYQKNQLLYGIHQAKNEIVKKDSCLLVEGYTDVLSMHQAGINNVVASSGTALTEGQVKLVKRYSENITILYDGDPAGIKASFRGIDIILEQGMNVNILLLPEEDDPDSFAQKHTRNEVLEFIDRNREDFITFKTKVLLKETESSPTEKAGAIKDIVKSISVIPDHITRALYTKECSTQLDVPEKAIMAEVNKLRRDIYYQKRRRKERDTRQKGDKYDHDTPSAVDTALTEKSEEKKIESFDFEAQERDVLRILMRHSSRLIDIDIYLDESDKTEGVQIPVGEFIVSELMNDHLSFSNPVYKEMLETCIASIQENGDVNEQALIHHENEEVRKTAADLISEKYELHDWQRKSINVTTEIGKMEAAAKGALYAFKTKYIERMIKENQTMIQKAQQNGEDVIPLLKTQQKLDHIKRNFSLHQGITVLR